MTSQEFFNSINLDGEEWRDIIGYEGLYMVSSYGRVIGLPISYMRNKGIHTKDYRILKQTVHPRKKLNYYRIRLSKNHTNKLVYVHRLVAMAFIPNPNNFPFIDHIDRNGLNNNVSNLRWCDQKMNMNNEKTRIVHVKALREKSLKKKSLITQNVKELSTDA